MTKFNPAEWVVVSDYPNYAVSITGLVLNIKRNRLVAQNMDRGGLYKRVTLWKGNKCNGAYVHRLVASAFLLNPQGKPQVNHIDGDKLNNHVENLEWVTAKENNDHARDVLNRPFAKGELSGKNILSRSEVDEIRARYTRGKISHESLAKEYGVSRPTISTLLAGKSWRD